MNILLVGGTGFLGARLAARLAQAGHRLTLPTRRYERAKYLTVLPCAEVVAADVHDPATLAELCRGRDAVYSLVGILKGGEGQPYGSGFARAHVDLPRKIAAAVVARNVPRLIHVSALQASPAAPSGYLRSKAAGEAALLAVKEATAVTILRPSVIFGRGDSFLTLFARLLRRVPALPLACPTARFQPVWVDDVVAALVASLAPSDGRARAFDLCGPTVYTLRDLVAYAGRVSGHARPIVGLPDALAWLQAWAMEFVPNGPMTRDNIRSMQVPSVCAEGCARPFGLPPATPLEAVAPGYLAP